MPCSRSGQSYPLPAPPQAFMKLPAASNTTIAGAAFPESSGLSVRGRCRSQTLSCASMAKLDASPSLNCGGSFGHAGSTSNTGTLRACAGDCAAALVVKRHAAGTPAAMRYVTRPMRPRVLRFTASSCHILFDHLVGAGEERRRDFQAEHPGSLCVDDELHSITSLARASSALAGSKKAKLRRAAVAAPPMRSKDASVSESADMP